MKKIQRNIVCLALVLLLSVPLALFGSKKEEKPVILQCHGYRGTTSEVLRASGFLDGVTGNPLPPAKAKVIDVDPDAIETWNTWKVEAYTSIFESTEKNPIKAGRVPFIGYIPLSIYNPWDMLNKDAFEWYCRDVLGWNHKVYWSDADPKKQNDLADLAIKDGVDAIVLCAADSLANAKIGEMGKKAGVPVVIFGIDIFNSWPMAFVQRDDYESGWYCGKYVRDKLIEEFGADIKIGIDIPIVDVGNSWDAEAEFPYVKAAMAANPDIVAVFEVMGGYHEAWVRAAKDLGWSEEKIKDVIAVDVDFFPVNIDGYINGYQDYTRMMPTGGYMTATCLEILKQFWKYGPEALPHMGDIFSVEEYVPELQTLATVPGTDFAPLQWYEHTKWGVVGYTIRPSTCGAAYTPWVLIPDRVVTEADYKEPFIYWNWPVFGYPHRPEILK